MTMFNRTTPDPTFSRLCDGAHPAAAGEITGFNDARQPVGRMCVFLCVCLCLCVCVCVCVCARVFCVYVYVLACACVYKFPDRQYAKIIVYILHTFVQRECKNKLCVRMCSSVIHQIILICLNNNILLIKRMK